MNVPSVRNRCLSVFAILAAATISAVPSASAAPTASPGRADARATVAAGPYVPGELLVRFRSGATPFARSSAHASAGAVKLRGFRIVPGLERVRLPKGASVERAAALYRRRPDVLYAEPNYIAHAAGPPVEPNDPLWGDQWSFRNLGGPDGSVPDADIDMDEAWALIATPTPQPAPVVVGVIDTGMAWNHEDLEPNIWTNPDEVEGDGLDNDGNGWVDDRHGADCVDQDGDPSDPSVAFSHGTHVAGTIGAVGDNAKGVAGAVWDVDLMPIRVLNAQGSGNWADIIEGIQYAHDNGADVINMSLGGGGTEPASLRDAVAAFGGLACCAAGNNGTNNDATPNWPASLDLPNVLAVGATTPSDTPSSYSNHGATSVDVFAPGDGIVSTNPKWDRVFRDEFPSLDAWYAGDYVTKPWALDATYYTSAPYSAAHTSYAANEFSAILCTQPVDLSGYSAAGVRFLTRFSLEYGYDFLLVYASDDLTFTGDEIVGMVTGSSVGRWLRYGFDASSIAGGTGYIGFALWSDESFQSTGVRIDDVEVYGTNWESDYVTVSGTSMATPHTAGIAAFLLSEKPALTSAEVKALIMSSVDTKTALAGLCVTGGRVNAAAARVALGDVDPPSTTATGVPDGWSSADVTVTLEATDTESGVAATYYSLGGAPESQYSAPFAVSAEGTTVVAFRSVDVSGNAEPTRTVVTRIDKSPPVTTSDALGNYDASATIHLSASDAYSGVAQTEYRLDGGVWTSGTVVQTAASGDHALEFRSTDAVGNVEATVTVTFNIFGPFYDEVPAGDGVTVDSGAGVTVRFDHVLDPGTLTVRPVRGPYQRLPANWRVADGTYYEIEPAFPFSGGATVTVPFDPKRVRGAERNALLFHKTATGWRDLVTEVDEAVHTASGRTDGFSPFAVGYSPWEPTSTSNVDSLNTPHKGYAIGTNKCAVCHAMHSAEATGELLLPSSALDACTYCHVTTGLGIERIYNGVAAAYSTDTSVGAFGGGFAHNAPDVGCVGCHAVHGARTLDGGNTTKILKDWTYYRDAPGGFSDYSTLALAAWPVPRTVAGKYAQQSAWCTGCHKYYVTSYETTIEYVEGGDWGHAKSHVMTSAPKPYANSAGSFVGTAAFAPSAFCRHCHDAGVVDTTGGLVPSSFPHYTPDNYRFMSVGGSVADSGSVNTTGTVDGLCLKCHRDGLGSGVGGTF